MFRSVAGFGFMESGTTPTLVNIKRSVISLSSRHPGIVLVCVLCAHLAVFAALPQHSQLSTVETIPEPITVSLLSAAQPTPEKPLSSARPIEKAEKPIKKPVTKPVLPRIKPSQPTAQSVEQTATPVTQLNTPSTESETKMPQAANSKPVEYQSPSFNAAYLNNPAPNYPPLSRRLGEEGRVLLRVQVMQDGTPGSVELQTGSGSSRLDQAALEAVKKWRFTPAKRGEQTVTASVVVPISFSIEG